MGNSDYLRVVIGDMEVEVTNPEELPISINYALEDAEDFTKKKSSSALGISIPATLINDQAANTFRNAGINDMTVGKLFRSHQPCVIECSGMELLVGKAFLKTAIHTDKPVSYLYDLYGNSASWLIDLKESTLYDFLKHIAFVFTRQNIIDSWQFNGTKESLPYVFAPVRYRQPFDKGRENYVQVNANEVNDLVLKADYMKPSLSIYWLLFWGFKSVGYKIQSDFFNTDYFRRSVMPWTWGSFLTSEGTQLELHKFEAKSNNKTYAYGDYNDYMDLAATKVLFDNNLDYSYNAAQKQMEWKYNAPDFGALEANLSLDLYTQAEMNWNSWIELEIRWWKVDVNGVLSNPQVERVLNFRAGALGGSPQNGEKLHNSFYKSKVTTGEKIICRIHLKQNASATGEAEAWIEVISFKMDFFRKGLGGTINFADFIPLKKYMFLDFLKGIIEMFNLSFNTDAASKTLYIEPTHEYSLTSDLNQKNNGYFKDDFIDWNGKEDLSREWQMQNFDEYEKEVVFKFKDDTNDGILKLIQDRNINTVASGKYCLPDLFKTGRKEIENSFFSPLMHYEVEQWKSITGVAPQIPVIVPENISNTSQSEADNTFLPKIAYYKGNISGVGGWRFEESVLSTFPFMFSVNYQDGGQDDPILSYSDERIKSGNGYVIGKGLVKRFYWQRLANIRNGQYYYCWFRLKNYDVAGQLHREYKSYLGQKWELININDYKPLQEVSTSCLLRRWTPIEQTDYDNTFPGADSVLNGNAINKLDMKYASLKCFPSDIPV